MIINTQKLRSIVDELEARVSALEEEMVYIKKGETPPPPAKEQAPKPELPPKPKGGLRHWGSGPGQMDCGTSYRWRKR